MINAVADTHAVIWYLTEDKRLSGKAEAVFDTAFQSGDTIGISAISFVEVVYLTEKGTIPSNMMELLEAALNEENSFFEEHPVRRSLIPSLKRISRNAIPDMPDRIIAATALHLKVPLISRDGKITVSGIETIW